MELRLLGHPELSVAGAPVRLPTRNSVLLLALLAVEGAQSREQLAGILWPDADASRGRANLRKTIAYVRDAFGREVDVITGDARTLTLVPSVSTDIALVRGCNRPEPSLESLQAAVGAWRGDFMAGIEAEADVLDEWLAQQRANWAQVLAVAAERLIALASAQGDHATALAAAEAWLARDPLAELAHQARIRVHLLRGDAAAALDAYARCADVLEQELGIEPAAETTELANRARGGALTTVAPPALDRAEVPMVGREREHGALTAAFERTRRGRSELVVMVGEAGIGKTRLLREFAAWLSAQRAEVIRITPFPSGRRIAYQALEPAFGDLIADASRHRAGGDRRLAAAVARDLASRSTASPLVFVVDDLQWLDPDTLSLLALVISALAAEARPALWVVSVREDELRTRTTLQAWIDEAGRPLELTEIALSPLPPDETARLVALWPESPGDAAAGAVARCGGRPLLVVETLRYLTAGGDAESIAPAIRQSMSERLRSLNRDEVALAEAAAVLERGAGVALLGTLSGLEPAQAADVVDELLRKHVFTGDGEYAFSHELLRQAAYTMLGPERRRLLHRRTQQVLRDAGGGAAECAHHAELGGDAAAAFRLHLEAARDAMALPAYRAAAQEFRAAIAIEADALDAWLGLGRAEELSGQAAAARSTYESLVSRARERGRPADEAAALTRLAELAGRDLSAEAPVDLLVEAAAAAADAGDAATAVEARLGEAQVLAYRGRLSEAARLLAATNVEIATLGRADLSARSLNLDAFINQACGRWSAALNLARRAKAAYRHLGEPLMVLDSTGYEGASLVFLGRWSEALQLARRALREADRLGNPWAICNLSLIEGWALHESGEVQGALAAALRGVESGKAAGFAPLQVMNAALAGRCHRESGDVEAALALHREALATARTLHGVAVQLVTEELAGDHASVGDWTSALAWAEESIASRGEMWMFANLALPVVAETFRRFGREFEVPPLPQGERYRLIELRTRAVIAGSEAEREALIREALDIAERLHLRLEVAELSAELDVAARS